MRSHFLCGLNERAKCVALSLIDRLSAGHIRLKRSHVDGERSDRIPLPAPFIELGASAPFSLGTIRIFRVRTLLFTNYLLTGHLLGNGLRHCEGESSKQSSFYQFKKVGNMLTQKVRNVRFGWPKCPHICTFCPNNCTLKLLLGFTQPTDYRL